MALRGSTVRLFIALSSTVRLFIALQDSHFSAVDYRQTETVQEHTDTSSTRHKSLKHML